MIECTVLLHTSDIKFENDFITLVAHLQFPPVSSGSKVAQHHIPVPPSNPTQTHIPAVVIQPLKVNIVSVLLDFKNVHQVPTHCAHTATRSVYREKKVEYGL